MRKNLFAFIICLIGFVSCNSVPDITILEQLTIEELSEAIESDTAFSTTYKFINDTSKTGFKTWLNSSDIIKAKYSKVTYSDFNDYRKWCNDSIEWNKRFLEIKDKYYETYPDFRLKIDSVINYWNKIYNNTDYHNYIKLTYDTFYVHKYSWGDVDDICFKFNINKLKNNIGNFKLIIDNFYINDKYIYTSEYDWNIKYENDSTLYFIYDDYSNNNDIYNKLKLNQDSILFKISAKEFYVNKKDIIEEHNNIPKEIKYILDAKHNYINNEDFDTEYNWTFDRTKLYSYYAMQYYNILNYVDNYETPDVFENKYIDNFCLEYNETIALMFKNYWEWVSKNIF